MHSIYLVDDELPALELLRGNPAFLESGFALAGASTNPLIALEEIRAEQPDVVITDLKMPGLNGIQLMERLRQEDCKAEFVIVSAYSEFSEVRRFFTSHGFDYLIKPVPDRDLADLLRRLSVKLGYSPPQISQLTPSGELNKLLSFLKDYPAMRHTLETLGERFSFHPNYICNLFSKYLETTFTAYMTELRMEQARELLLHTDKSIKEISIICGYSDYFYFCRVFRERHACTPTRFREAGDQS